jgi:hypothetical protein
LHPRSLIGIRLNLVQQKIQRRLNIVRKGVVIIPGEQGRHTSEAAELLQAIRHETDRLEDEEITFNDFMNWLRRISVRWVDSES